MISADQALRVARMIAAGEITEAEAADVLCSLEGPPAVTPLNRTIWFGPGPEGREDPSHRASGDWPGAEAWLLSGKR